MIIVIARKQKGNFSFFTTGEDKLSCNIAFIYIMDKLAVHTKRFDINWVSLLLVEKVLAREKEWNVT